MCLLHDSPTRPTPCGWGTLLPFPTSPAAAPRRLSLPPLSTLAGGSEALVGDMVTGMDTGIGCWPGAGVWSREGEGLAGWPWGAVSPAEANIMSESTEAGEEMGPINSHLPL